MDVFRPGDVIIEVDRRPVSDPDQLRRRAAGSGNGLLLLLYRGGTTMYVGGRR